jgi:hypothetical protein
MATRMATGHPPGNGESPGQSRHFPFSRYTTRGDCNGYRSERIAEAPAGPWGMLAAGSGPKARVSVPGLMAEPHLSL